MSNPTFDIYLVNGNITVFCGTHTEGFKSDILNSSLLAELMAARQNNDRGASWTTYTNTIAATGWITNSRSIQRSEFDNSRLFELVTESTLGELSSHDQLALVNAFTKLKKLPPDSLAIKTLIHKLQVNAAPDDPKEPESIATAALLTIVRQDKAMVTLQMAFMTTEGITIDILDQPVLSAIQDGKTNFRLLRSALDGRQYNEVRDIVIKKLGRKIETELLHV